MYIKFCIVRSISSKYCIKTLIYLVIFILRHMEFIVHRIVPGKVGLVCKISFMDIILLQYTPFHRQVAIDDQVCFPRW